MSKGDKEYSKSVSIGSFVSGEDMDNRYQFYIHEKNGEKRLLAFVLNRQANRVYTTRKARAGARQFLYAMQRYNALGLAKEEGLKYPIQSWMELDEEGKWESPCFGMKRDFPAYDWMTVRSIESVKYLLSQRIVNKLSLDHDMGDIGDSGTGYDLVKWMAETNTWPDGQIWVHSANPVGAKNMVGTINRYHPDDMKAITGNPFDLKEETQ